MVDMTASVPQTNERPSINILGLFGKGVLYTTLIIFAVVALLPFFWMISTSLMTLGETQLSQLTPSDPQWGNYSEAWTDANFSEYFINSVIIALVTIGGLLVITILSAYAFARIDFFGKNLIFTLILATLMIPESVLIIPNFLIVSDRIFPLPGGSWIDSLPALTIPFMGSAFSIFLLRQFFMQIPNELWEAARIDGCGHLRFLLTIVLPISRAPVLTVVLLTFIGSWNALLWPLIVTNNDDWRPIAYGLQKFAEEAGTQQHLQMAGAFITIMPMLVLYFMTQKTFTEGIATTGLKG